MKKFQSNLKNFINPNSKRKSSSLSNGRKQDKPWFERQYHDANKTSIKKPDELEQEMSEPPAEELDSSILNRIQGSMVGMAIGDALGAHVEFRPRQYLVSNPVTDLEGGGTWGLAKGQFTDDTTMALCLANSLVTRQDFCPYDQMVRYKWWYRNGYMSSTGQCFDIGAATSDSLLEFERRQKLFAKKNNISSEEIDYISDENLLRQFNVYCSTDQVAGNGALMRLAPVPLFFFRNPQHAVKFSGISGQITHGDRKAYDACRYYGALITAALHGYSRDQLLQNDFYANHKDWFGGEELCSPIKMIAEGSYKKKGGYENGIRGKGYIVNALEAALWAFWSDDNSFEKGALAAVNLGDDTDTTAAIYGQLAGACYGFRELPRKWVRYVYARDFILKLSKWICYEGQRWQAPGNSQFGILSPVSPLPGNETVTRFSNVGVAQNSNNYGPSYQSNQEPQQARRAENRARGFSGSTGVSQSFNNNDIASSNTSYVNDMPPRTLLTKTKSTGTGQSVTFDTIKSSEVPSVQSSQYRAPLHKILSSNDCDTKPKATTKTDAYGYNVPTDGRLVTTSMMNTSVSPTHVLTRTNVSGSYNMNQNDAATRDVTVSRRAESRRQPEGFSPRNSDLSPPYYGSSTQYASRIHNPSNTTGYFHYDTSDRMEVEIPRSNRPRDQIRPEYYTDGSRNCPGTTQNDPRTSFNHPPSRSGRNYL